MKSKIYQKQNNQKSIKSGTAKIISENKTLILVRNWVIATKSGRSENIGIRVEPSRRKLTRIKEYPE